MRGQDSTCVLNHSIANQGESRRWIGRRVRINVAKTRTDPSGSSRKMPTCSTSHEGKCRGHRHSFRGHIHAWVRCPRGSRKRLRSRHPSRRSRRKALIRKHPKTRLLRTSDPDWTPTPESGPGQRTRRRLTKCHGRSPVYRQLFPAPDSLNCLPIQSAMRASGRRPSPSDR
jgi:hypothetical protein